MARIYDKIVRSIGDSLLAEDILTIKKELTEVQRLLSDGKFDEAQNKLLGIMNTIAFLLRSMDDSSIREELWLADWRLQRAFLKLQKRLGGGA